MINTLKKRVLVNSLLLKRACGWCKQVVSIYELAFWSIKGSFLYQANKLNKRWYRASLHPLKYHLFIFLRRSKDEL